VLGQLLTHALSWPQFGSAGQFTEKSARQIALVGRVTGRSERRPAFHFKYRLEISLAVSSRLRFIRLHTGTRVSPVHNGTAPFLAWSAKNLLNFRNHTLDHAVGRPVVPF
jgi:hypothetical protein